MAFRWGIIGPGNIAHEFTHDLKYVNNEKHIVQAIVAKDIESAREFAATEQVAECYDDINAFLNESSVDAVYIATPHALHYEQTLQCLNRQIPVLCEKPIAINSEQLQEMIDTAVRNNTFLMEGMWIRFLPSIEKTMEVINSGMLGELLHLRADMSYPAPKDPENRFFNPALGGGSLLDLGIYPVYLALLLFGPPDEIKATGRLSSKGVDETCAALLDYQNGRYAVAESSIVSQTSLQAEVYGSKAKLVIQKQWNEKPPALVIESYDGKAKTIELNWEGRGFQFEVEEVISSIQNRKIENEKMSHKFSLELMNCMDEIRRQMSVRYPADQLMH
jgi:scyllo-inositol 2-dehydrogenase (NADP+)